MGQPPGKELAVVATSGRIGFSRLPRVAHQQGELRAWHALPSVAA